jgi:DnaJ-class molecular chaperone
MSDHTTNPNVRKTPCDLLLHVFGAIGAKIFREDDRRARDQGWQVTPRHSGLGRIYRDPRFDYLIPCSACSGRGYNPDHITCSGCHGTGRLVLDRAHTTQPRRGQQGSGQA